MTKPLHDQEQFGLRLGLVARLWRAEIDRRLATFGLTESRWLTLLHLSRLPQAATQRELAEAVGVRGPTLVRALDRLEAEDIEFVTHFSESVLARVQFTIRVPQVENRQLPLAELRENSLKNPDVLSGEQDIDTGVAAGERSPLLDEGQSDLVDEVASAPLEKPEAEAGLEAPKTSARRRMQFDMEE